MNILTKTDEDTFDDTGKEGVAYLTQFSKYVETGVTSKNLVETIIKCHD